MIAFTILAVVTIISGVVAQRILEEWVFTALVSFTVLLIGFMPALTYVYSHYNERTLTCTVTDKDRGGDDGSYRIYTEQCGQLANSDTWWRGKYDSADLWQRIEPGQTYTMTVVGWRAPFFSDFPTVLTADPVR